MRLAERAGVWNAQPENRYLPSLWEYLNIRLLTDKKKWTSPQRTMMGRAGRFHGFRVGLAVLVMAAVNAAGFAINARVQDRENRNYASALVQSLLAANTADVANLVGEIDTNQDELLVRRAGGVVRAVWVVLGELTLPRMAGWPVAAKCSGRV